MCRWEAAPAVRDDFPQNLAGWGSPRSRRCCWLLVVYVYLSTDPVAVAAVWAIYTLCP